MNSPLATTVQLSKLGEDYQPPLSNMSDDYPMTSKYEYDALTLIHSMPKRRSTPLRKSSTLKMLCLCCFGVLLPVLCIVVPVYARYILYADSVVTFAASDMRLVDNHISTAWCQGQNLAMNVSFDAYLMDKPPPLTSQTQTLSMTRHFQLDDDLKEYWGFYLLKGSKVTISSCAKYLGANVMLIEGINSLKFCAYVGQVSTEDDSSETTGNRYFEGRKMVEQYEMATLRSPSDPLFRQHNRKKERARILALLASQNEKRRLIKLLERENINSNGNESLVSSDVLSLVEKTLQKILHQEIQSLYREVKTILNAKRQPPTGNVAETKWSVRDVVDREKNNNKNDKWPVRPSLANGIVTEEVADDEDGAFETDDDAPKINVVTDGIADDRGTIDTNHVNDTSDSLESSFSSSEEAMLHCRGVLLSQPLIPQRQCSRTTVPTRNTITYEVEESGYYYFIFSSANEKVRNELTVNFTLEKTVFDVMSATQVCHNATWCNFGLNFASDQKIVVAMPVPADQFSDEWDHTFVARSACEPRTSLYLVFFIILPFSIILCAVR